MNKLRVLSVGGGAFLVAASVWASFRYAGSASFGWPVVLGVLVAGLPIGLAYGKLWARRGWRRLRHVRADDPPRDVSYVSESRVEDPESELAAIADAVRDADGLDAARRKQFDDGDGLVVTHAGFHSSFVRLTSTGRLVVTGASRRTRRLVEAIEATRPRSLTRSANNPLRRSDPVRGAPRVFLGVLLVGLVLVGVGGVADGAYPDDAYTAGEKAVLVSIDARADVDPGTSSTDASLAKAAFVVGAIEEEAVEVRWESNGTSAEVVDEHGRSSLRMSEDVRALVSAVRSGSPSAAQASRADRIEADLHRAEAAVAAAITARLEAENLSGETAGLRATRDELRAASEDPV